MCAARDYNQHYRQGDHRLLFDTVGSPDQQVAAPSVKASTPLVAPWQYTHPLPPHPSGASIPGCPTTFAPLATHLLLVALEHGGWAAHASDHRAMLGYMPHARMRRLNCAHECLMHGRADVQRWLQGSVRPGGWSSENRLTNDRHGHRRVLCRVGWARLEVVLEGTPGSSAGNGQV
ncbi:hypothetical protein BD779DRAFT_1477125 [Infundibulicybe gibba]|nr:hypothetical protein BD779DRAFT_1477125 [Infundibulicybe gibba]